MPPKLSKGISRTFIISEFFKLTLTFPSEYFVIKLVKPLPKAAII